MLKKALIVLFVLLLGSYIVGFFLPSDWRVDRSRVIKADRALIHSYVADLHTWPDWTAWNRKLDPECNFTFSGAPAGKGAVYAWDGPELGEGRLELTAATLSGGVEFTIEFGEDPPAYGSIQYADAEGGVRVTWSLWGVQEGSIGRWVGVAMDGLVGPDLAAGLEGLERACTTGLAGRVEAAGKDLLEEVLD